MGCLSQKGVLSSASHSISFFCTSGSLGPGPAMISLAEVPGAACSLTEGTAWCRGSAACSPAAEVACSPRVGVAGSPPLGAACSPGGAACSP